MHRVCHVRLVAQRPTRTFGVDVEDQIAVQREVLDLTQRHALVLFVTQQAPRRDDELGAKRCHLGKPGRRVNISAAAIGRFLPADCQDTCC